VPGLISSSQAGCFFNPCGPGSLADGGVANGSDFYAACNAQASSDGNCLPFTVAQNTVAGFCEQAGGVVQNSPCGTTRGDAGGLCQNGAICVVLNIDANGTFMEGSACLPVCAVGAPMTPDGGPGCATGSSCIPIFNGQVFGACFQTCVIATPNCPSPLVCLSIGDPTNGVCGPM
jgi:hypothetical protein